MTVGTMLDESKRQFIRLIAQHERQIYGYILCMVRNWADADEIVQETNIRLWEEFEQFEAGTSFLAWAKRVAYFQVRTWRKKQGRNKLVFDQDLVDLIATEHDRISPTIEAREQVLEECLEQLTATNRQLLALFYADRSQVHEVAAIFDRTVPAVYKALQRIRATLRLCVERKLASEESA
jgi:RNA polymerase sigma-70 factor (ECF subfamily)